MKVASTLADMDDCAPNSYLGQIPHGQENEKPAGSFPENLTLPATIRTPPPAQPILIDTISNIFYTQNLQQPEIAEPSEITICQTETVS